MDASEGQEVARSEVGERALVVVHGDLAAQRVDTVVNAANERMAHGGGVAAALATAGGPSIQQDSDAWVADHGPVGPGQAAVTGAGDMPARWVIHVVGPRYREGRDNNETLLRQAVTAALDAARDAGASSIALPAISAGIFGYPPAEAARVIADESARWLRTDPGDLSEIRLVGYDAQAADRFTAGL